MTQGTRYRWHLTPTNPAVVRTLAYANQLTLPIAQVLAARGIATNELVRSFLFGSYEEDVPQGLLLKGMDAASERIIKAIERKEKILIFGDYDVDGVTSTSMCLAALLPLGANINFFLPNRDKDGYGLSEKAVAQAHKNDYALIITVDNGISAFAAAEKAARLGIDLIITDHHKAHGHLPPALAIVNPNQSDCGYPFKSLAGVGVAFKLMSVIYEKLGIKSMPEKMYELLMLGTIADVVPLVGENRFWVRYGLQRVNHYQSTAFTVLAQNSNLQKTQYDSLDIGFMIAPQINALGRLSDPRDAVKFMISAERSDVEKVGAILKEMNEKRKHVERKIYDGIEEKITTKHINLDRDFIIMTGSDSWPSGVIGLVAGKLMHNYGRPSILFHLDKNGIAKGSCRSIPEFNIFEALTANQDLLIQFGGHACAAGLKLKQENIPALKERLSAQLAARFSLTDLQPKLTIDAMLQLPEVSQHFIDQLESLEPFGNQNPQPLFMINNVTLLKQPQLLKEKHVKCMVFDQGVIKPVIFFNRPDLVGILQQLQDKSFTLAAHVTKNEWGGTVRSELQGLDIALQDY